MTTEDVPLDFIELQHELQGFGGRVIAVEIRSDTGELIAHGRSRTPRHGAGRICRFWKQVWRDP